MRGLKFAKVVLSVSVFLTLSVGIILSATAQLPNPEIEINPKDTALVITDPQNDFLSPEGVTWGVVGESVTENKMAFVCLKNGQCKLQINYCQK